MSVDTTGGASSYKELVEKLAAIEHERWADWQRWVHDQGRLIGDSPMDMVIPEAMWKRWQRQIDTPYDKLSEREKQSDREQVQRYLPLLHSLLISKLPEKSEVKYKKWIDGMSDKPSSYKNNAVEYATVQGRNSAIDDMKAVLDEMFEVHNEK